MQVPVQVAFEEARVAAYGGSNECVGFFVVVFLLCYSERQSAPSKANLVQEAAASQPVLVSLPGVGVYVARATLFGDWASRDEGRQVLHELTPLGATKSLDDGSDGLKPSTIAQLVPLTGSPVALGASAPANGLDKQAVEAGPGLAYELPVFHGFKFIINLLLQVRGTAADLIEINQGG